MNKPVFSEDYKFGHSVDKTLLKSESSGEPLSRCAVQEEMAKLITALKRVERCLIVADSKKEQTRKQELEVIRLTLTDAVNLLQQNPHKIFLVKKLRQDAEFTLREFTNPIIGRFINAFKYVVYESTTPGKVLFGLSLAVPIYLMVPYLPYKKFIVQPLIAPILVENKYNDLSATKSNLQETRRITQYDVDRTIALLVLVGVAGSLGSIVSILTRIKEYENEKYTDKLLPVLIGAFKPLIGGVFGIFLFTLLASGFLPLQIKNDNSEPINEWYALFAIAFVAGFSERLVKDIISQTEKKVIATSTTTSTFNQVDEQTVSSAASTTTATINQIEEQKVSSTASTSSDGNFHVTE